MSFVIHSADWSPPTAVIGTFLNLVTFKRQIEPETHETTDPNTTSPDASKRKNVQYKTVNLDNLKKPYKSVHNFVLSMLGDQVRIHSKTGALYISVIRCLSIFIVLTGILQKNATSYSSAWCRPFQHIHEQTNQKKKPHE